MRLFLLAPKFIPSFRRVQVVFLRVPSVDSNLVCSNSSIYSKIVLF